jgi:hypothetical protein
MCCSDIRDWVRLLHGTNFLDVRAFTGVYTPVNFFSKPRQSEILDEFLAGFRTRVWNPWVCNDFVGTGVSRQLSEHPVSESNFKTKSIPSLSRDEKRTTHSCIIQAARCRWCTCTTSVFETGPESHESVTGVVKTHYWWKGSPSYMLWTALWTSSDLSNVSLFRNRPLQSNHAMRCWIASMCLMLNEVIEWLANSWGTTGMSFAASKVTLQFVSCSVFAECWRFFSSSIARFTASVGLSIRMGNQSGNLQELSSFVFSSTGEIRHEAPLLVTHGEEY